MIIRLHLVVTRLSGAGVTEDEAITTHDFNLGLGTSDPTRDSITTQLETLTDAFCASMQTHRRAVIVVSEYRWYDLDPEDLLFGEPYRVTPKNIIGTNTSGSQLPPQVALSVTERTTLRKRWGRFYIPGLTAVALDSYGRVSSGVCTSVADAVDVWYTGAKAAGAEPIVLGAPDPVSGQRPWVPVTLIQVDDVFDVIRRRRFDQPTLRVQRAF